MSTRRHALFFLPAAVLAPQAFAAFDLGKALGAVQKAGNALRLSDDEVRHVIGHEIGHVLAGHSRKRLQLALSTGAAQQALAAGGGRAAALAEGGLGELFVKVVRAQHSPGNELEADDLAMRFLAQRGHDCKSAVTALDKLDTLSGGAGGAPWLSTHPAPRDRADRMRQQAAA